jgi:hypothetical protein
MPLDTRIALGAQPLQLDNPLASYGQAVGIQNAMQQNQLGQMQMSAAQRAAEEEMGAKNYLATNPDLSTVEGQRGLLPFGKTGLAYQKAIAEQNKAKSEAEKLSAEVLGLNQKNFTALNSPIRAAAGGEAGVASYVEALYADPVMGALARKVKPKEQSLAENLAMFKQDPQQWVTAHSNLEGTHLLDALKMSQENEAEKARIASRGPAPVATAIGAPNATGAGLVTPGAAAVAPVLKQIGDFRIDPSISSVNTFKLQQMSGQGPIKLSPNEYYGEDASGKLVIKTIPASTMAPVAAGANALALAAAVGVNALAAPTGNDATLQAMAVERKRLSDRLNVLTGLRYSKGVENEMKDVQAQLKELSTPINLREAGTAITPFGSVTAPPAPGEMEKLALAEAAARKAGNTDLADVLAGQIKVKNQLQDHRTEIEKLLAITADPNASKEAKDAANGRIANLTHVAKEATPAHIQEYEYAKKTNGYTGTLAEFLHPVQEPALIQEYNFAVKNGFKGSIYAFKSAPEHAPALVQEFEYAKKNGYKGSIADFKTLAAPVSPAPALVAIQSPTDATKTVYVAGPSAIGATPAAAVEKPLTAMQTQKLKVEKAADTAHVAASQSTANELEKLTNELVGSEDGKIKPHPGLGGITGYAALLPNLPKSDARQAQQKLDTFKGKVLALGRGLASQEGKLGNMAVQEWKFVSDAVEAIDPKAGNLDQQMRDVVRQAKVFANRQKSKFESTYEDTGAPAPSLGVDTSNPLLK